jgi:hypothetical protein
MKNGRESQEAQRLLQIIHRRRLHHEHDRQLQLQRREGQDFLSPLAQLKKVTRELQEDRQQLETMCPEPSKPLPGQTLDANRQRVARLVKSFDCERDLMRVQPEGGDRPAKRRRKGGRQGS